MEAKRKDKVRLTRAGGRQHDQECVHHSIRRVSSKGGEYRHEVDETRGEDETWNGEGPATGCVRVAPHVGVGSSHLQATLDAE